MTTNGTYYRTHPLRWLLIPMLVALFAFAIFGWINIDVDKVRALQGKPPVEDCPKRLLEKRLAEEQLAEAKAKRQAAEVLLENVKQGGKNANP